MTGRYLSKSPTSNTITVEVRISTYQFGGDTDIQTAAVLGDTFA